MKLYNTLTRKKEEFEPLEPLNVKLYCCGPTVYNTAHIGNLRTYVFEDLLRRALEFNGYLVEHVMNITDVGHLTSDEDSGEDKMKKGAEREKKTVWEIAENYTQVFLEDMDRLNMLKPTMKPKATDHIETMIAQIQQLEAKKLTYLGQNGNVYFDTSKVPDYGKLAQLEKQELRAGARIEVDTNKRNPADFVLWFVSSKHGDQDMQWDSPWGRGFPGWHIECSAMSMKYLGNQFDIHCGGIDHIPVHHSNELAQAEGASGVKPWVKVWMHGEFLLEENLQFSLEEKEWEAECPNPKCKRVFPVREKNVYTEGKDEIDASIRSKRPIVCPFCNKQFIGKEVTFTASKMSKSADNFLTLRRLIEEGYDPLDYRYFCLQAHYRKQLSFSWASLSAARTGLRRLKDKVGDLGETEGTPDAKFMEKFTTAISDDLNLSQALAIGWELLDDKNLDNSDKLSTIKKFDTVLGLKLDEPITFELPPQITAWILERNEARKNKDFSKSDALREQIESSGKWQVKDGPGGTEVTPL